MPAAITPTVDSAVRMFVQLAQLKKNGDWVEK